MREEYHKRLGPACDGLRTSCVWNKTLNLLAAGGAAPNASLLETLEREVGAIMAPPRLTLGG
ncbi:MAG: hypothetical protein HY332_05160 [Chloroflexi bacterium]|nr:hypothetical protein [Chloroflexota bacterium]